MTKTMDTYTVETIFKEFVKNIKLKIGSKHLSWSKLSVFCTDCKPMTTQTVHKLLSNTVDLFVKVFILNVVL